MTKHSRVWALGAKARWFFGLAVVVVAAVALTSSRGSQGTQSTADEPAAFSGIAGAQLADPARVASLIRSVDARLQPRPYLGITYVAVSSQAASRYGLAMDWGILVTAVATNGPADRAGVKAGDVLLVFDDRALTPEVSFLDLLWHQRPGVTVKLVVWREGRHFTAEATLGSR